MSKSNAQPRAGRSGAYASFLRRHLAVLLAVALGALLLHDVFGPHGFLAMRRQKQEVQKLRDEIQKLNEENHRLVEEVKALKTDPKAIERIAREEMGLARPGELIFKLPPKPAEKESPAKKEPPED